MTLNWVRDNREFDTSDYNSDTQTCIIRLPGLNSEFDKTGVRHIRIRDNEVRLYLLFFRKFSLASIIEHGECIPDGIFGISACLQNKITVILQGFYLVAETIFMWSVASVSPWQQFPCKPLLFFTGCISYHHDTSTSHTNMLSSCFKWLLHYSIHVGVVFNLVLCCHGNGSFHWMVEVIY